MVQLNYVGTILKNIENLGYTFSENLIERLQKFSLEELTVFYSELMEDLREMVGAYQGITKNHLKIYSKELTFS